MIRRPVQSVAESSTSAPAVIPEDSSALRTVECFDCDAPGSIERPGV